ncbi:MAG: HAD family phosphatase [Lachnospiraceae bacterium]|nr:HAD family phosphatase [Lachnospiraceae bacterium]
MIKTVIFDIGNVLAGFDWEPYFRQAAGDEEIFERLVKATVMNPVWDEYDRGIWTEEEVLQGFIDSDPEIEAVIRKAVANMDEIINPKEYAVSWVQELKKKGYQVLVLSNYSKKAHRETKRALAFLKYTDGGILSYQDKMIKPQPEIYQLLLKRYHLNASECVFLDDRKENVEGAAKEGIHTILFESREQALRELKELGVE